MNTTEPTSEGSKGVEKEAEGVSNLRVWPSQIKQAYRDGYIAGGTVQSVRVKQLESENAACLAALKELTIIAEYYHDKKITYTEMPYKNWNEAIERAKKLAP